MIYFIQAEGLGHIKIGFTDDADAACRIATLQTGSPVPLKLLGTMPGTLGDEKDLHRRFAAQRVHGEWFKPVPELLAIIPGTSLPSCGSIEVTERSVSIRVLTVGRKQFSRSLLDQLPKKQLIDWEDVVSESAFILRETGGSIEETANSINFSLAVLDSDVWGWVAGGSCMGNQASGEYFTFRWVIFVKGGSLFKFLDYHPHHPDATDSRGLLRSGADHYCHLLRTIHPRRLTLPGFRDQDQLFFGV